MAALVQFRKVQLIDSASGAGYGGGALKVAGRLRKNYAAGTQRARKMRRNQAQRGLSLSGRQSG